MPYAPRLHRSAPQSHPWYGAAPAWLGGAPLPGAGGNLVGKGWAPPILGAPAPSVGSKPRHKHADPHLRYGTALPGVHGDTTPLIGSHSVGTKPHKRRDPHLNYPGMHGEKGGRIPHSKAGISHKPQGEDRGDAAHPGATDVNDPNYGSGSIAVDTDPMVNDTAVYIGMAHGIGTPGSFDAQLTGGGMSADSMQQGFDLYNDLDDTMNDIPATFQTAYDDPYSPPLREPTKRMYLANFGDDVDVGFEHSWYSGFGPAAIIGCDEDFVVAGDIGCANDTELKG